MTMKQTMIAPILIQMCIKDLEDLGDSYSTLVSPFLIEFPMALIILD